MVIRALARDRVQGLIILECTVIHDDHVLLIAVDVVLAALLSSVSCLFSASNNARIRRYNTRRLGFLGVRNLLAMFLAIQSGTVWCTFCSLLAYGVWPCFM